MNILFILPYPIDAGSTRQRVLQFFPYLEKNSIRCYARSFVSSDFYKIIYRPGKIYQKMIYTLKSVKSRIKDLNDLINYNVVFIQKEASPFGTTFIERGMSTKKPIVYDFDDAVYLKNPSQKSAYPILRNPSKTATIIKLSTNVIAGNQYLADYARKYNSNVHIIPTCIDTDYYKPVCGEQEKKKIVIGWIGSHSTISYLFDIKDVLRAVSKKHNCVFKIVADLSIDLDLRADFKQWRLDEECNDLRTFDIGIMPVPDNEWTRAKCGYKIIQYMAVGKPVVASPVGANKEIINDGENGFLAENESDWIAKLTALIENSTLRRKFGMAGRRTVEEKFSLKTNAPKLLEILLKSTK